MSLGLQKWEQSRSYYDSLTLKVDGDNTEQFGATKHQLDVSFSNYERFWRHHVAPATQRPVSANHFRPDTAKTVIEIAQWSYSVFAGVVEAHEYRDMVRLDDLGPRHRNWYNCVIWAGNALCVFDRLDGGVRKLESQVKQQGKRSQHKTPDWTSVIKYRNYVTHQGLCQVFAAKETQYVLRRSLVANTETWTKTISDFESHPEHFTSLQDAAREILSDSVKLLNDAYGRLVDDLRPLLEDARYQRLWGWEDGKSPVSGATGCGVIRSERTPHSSATARIPENTSAASGNRVISCATSSPPPKNDVTEY